MRVAVWPSSGEPLRPHGERERVRAAWLRERGRARGKHPSKAKPYFAAANVLQPSVSAASPRRPTCSICIIYKGRLANGARSCACANAPRRFRSTRTYRRLPSRDARTMRARRERLGGWSQRAHVIGMHPLRRAAAKNCGCTRVCERTTTFSVYMRVRTHARIRMSGRCVNSRTRSTGGAVWRSGIHWYQAG